MRTAVLATFVALSALSAHATPIRWDFDGQITGFGLGGGACLTDCLDLLAEPSFSGHILFNTDAPDMNGGDWPESFGLFINFAAGYRYVSRDVRVAVQPGNIAFSGYHIFGGVPVTDAFSRIGIIHCYDPGATGVDVADDYAHGRPPRIDVAHGCFDPPYLTTSGERDLAFRITRWDAVSVPEPSTLLLLGAGLFGVAATRRRRAAN